MRIGCPACSASYEVPAARVSPGRAVKCARCGERWEPIPPAAPVMAASPVSPRVEAIQVEPDEVVWAEEPVENTAPFAAAHPIEEEHPAAVGEEPAAPSAPAMPRANRAVAVAWVATMLVLAGVAWALATYRLQLVQAWPPLERLYVAVGSGRTLAP